MAKTDQEKTMGKLSETARRLNEYTLGALLPLWADNIAKNMPKILEGKNVEDLPKRKGDPALVIAAGPSLKRKKHLNIIAKSSWSHPIITCDRNLVKCLMRRIEPYCVCTVDANPQVAGFYNHKLVQKQLDKGGMLKPVLSIATNPLAVDAVYWEKGIHRRTIHWFVPFMDDAKNDPTSLTRMMHFMTKKSMLMVGGNVGTLSWNVAMYLGCNPIILVGFDLSYDDANITKSLYYQAMLKKLGDRKKVKKLYAMAQHPIYRNKYVLDPIFKSYREMFNNYVSVAHRLYGINTINATEGGAVFGEGIECMTLKEALRRYN